MGVTDCDNMLMLLAVSQKMSEKERDVVVPMMMRGFKVRLIILILYLGVILDIKYYILEMAIRYFTQANTGQFILLVYKSNYFPAFSQLKVMTNPFQFKVFKCHLKFFSHAWTSPASLFYLPTCITCRSK